MPLVAPDWLRHPLFEREGPFQGFGQELILLARPLKQATDVIDVISALKQWVPDELAIELQGAIEGAIEGAMVPQAHRQFSAAVAKAVAAGCRVSVNEGMGLLGHLWTEELRDWPSDVVPSLMKASGNFACSRGFVTVWGSMCTIWSASLARCCRSGPRMTRCPCPSSCPWKRT